MEYFQNDLMHSETIIVGWQETISFPDWKGIKLKAKVDTGAMSAAIHAEEYQVIRRPGTDKRPVNEELRLKIKVGLSSKPRFAWVQAPIVDYRNVKNSGGKIEERPFIETRIRVGAEIFKIIMSVTNREKMKFPVLLGRTFLAGKFLVDPSSKGLLKG